MDDAINVFTLESLMVSALQRRSLDPCILLRRGAWIERYYRLLGVRHFVYLDDYLSRVSVDDHEINRLLQSLATFKDLMELHYQQVRIGKYIASSLVRQTYSGGVNPRDPQLQPDLRRLLRQTMATTQAARAVYADWQPKHTLFLERGYTPYGEFFELSQLLGLNTMQWCGTHRDNGLMLKRYTAGNSDRHPASLSAKTWQMLLELPWDVRKRDCVRNELFQNYQSGRWFSEVGTQFNTQIFDRQIVLEQLGLNPNKKTAVLFSHLFWDATFFWGEDLFNDYEEWFIESVKAACANPNVNWVIKLHPANVVKLNRDGYRGELVEMKAIREKIGPLPSHVRVLEPSTKINTYSLFDVMDFCLTVRGTIGIEAALFGVCVLTAGTGRYDGHGFTLDSSSREEYLARIANLQHYSPMTKEQITLAEKFAYGTFLMRPFLLQSLNVSYQRDKTATMTVQWSLQNSDQVQEASDLKAFAHWALDLRDEDYLDSHAALCS